MELRADVSLSFPHRVVFTRDALDPSSETLAKLAEPSTSGPARVLAFIDTHVAAAMPDLLDRLRVYVAKHASSMMLVGRVQPVAGGELCKNDRDAIYRVLEAIASAKLDRQSYVLVIGGGAVLDCVGFAAAIAHRGVRLIRMPTTTLAQADSGVGVKSGINGFGQKNFLSAFAVPWAVINDERFLETLSDRDWRCGFVEAVKVACVKDADFFATIERSAAAITTRQISASAPILRRSAELHLQHIATGGDPFEMTTARPLDFGHWAAHRLEHLSEFALRHGEAVAIGIAIDTLYARCAGLLDSSHARRVCQCLRALGFDLWHDSLRDSHALMQGLEQFREHLGGRLTVTLLRGVGFPVDVHEIDRDLMLRAVSELKPLACATSTG